jgi:hypothetical protein
MTVNTCVVAVVTISWSVSECSCPVQRRALQVLSASSTRDNAVKEHSAL